MAEEEPPDDESSTTLVHTGKSALTFSEMAGFVHDIEARPPGRLVGDLAGLLALPEAKYQLVVMVLRKKTRPGGTEREAILEGLRRLRSAEDETVRKRATAFLDRPQ
jgi:hypothetical protein